MNRKWGNGVTSSQNIKKYDFIIKLIWRIDKNVNL